MFCSNASGKRNASSYREINCGVEQRYFARQVFYSHYWSSSEQLDLQFRYVTFS